MVFHHMMIVVSDIEESVKLWRDVLGFTVTTEYTIPNEHVAAGGLLDDIFHVKNASSRTMLLTDPDGTMIELQQPSNPIVKKAPREYHEYGYTGISELGLMVHDIEAVFKKVKEAGYELQTDFIWDAGPGARSFLFYDNDGAMIQIWEQENCYKPHWV